MTDASRFGHFDADTYRAAQEEPSLLVDGRLYVGRLLSIEEWLVHSDALRRMNETPNTPPQAYLALYRKYLRAVFPRRWWAIGPDPVRALFKLPWGTVVECINHFFVLQARASTPSSPSRSTSGTASPPETENPLPRPSPS